jgi:hypothetical protein
MTDRPILFSGPMVQALLSGRKTQTRRTLNPQPEWPKGCEPKQIKNISGGFVDGNGKGFPCRIQPGDRLWVREAWRVERCFDDRAPSKLPKGELVARQYEADGTRIYWKYDHLPAGRLRASMHMPRWASRTTLEVTDVRVERVQDISEADAMAEGVNGGCTNCGNEAPCGCHNPSPDHRDSYVWLWDSLNASRGFGWDENPWVVAVTFTVHKCNIDAMLKERSK